MGKWVDGGFMKEKIDISKMPEIINTINEALNNHQTIEIKNQCNKDIHVNISVYKIQRTALTRKPKIGE